MFLRYGAIVLSLGLPLGLTACSSTSSEPSPAATQVSNELSRPGVALFRGILSGQGDTATFTPCDSKQSWRFSADPGFWQRWQDLGNPKQLYAQVEGKLTLAQERGAPITLTLNQVDHLTPDLQSCQRDTNFAFRAFGHEPEWNLTLQGETALYSTPGGSQTYSLKSNQQEANGVLTLSLTSLEGDDAELIFTPALCQESQANQIWGYEVKLKQGENQLLGCGERGRPLADVMPPLQWYGISAQMKAQVGLTLTEDHLANLSYYRDSGPKVEYAGVWQPTPQGLELLFNQRNGWGVSEQIPFTRDGQQLSAKYRKINGAQAYFDEPLLLRPGTPALPVAPQDQSSAHASGSETPTRAAFTPVVLQASLQEDGAVKQALLDYFAINKSNPDGVQYRYLTYDLNDDNYPDALVQMNWCDKSGCVWLLFQGSVDGYRFLGRIEGMQGPILISPNTTQGWHNLVVQSGFQQWSTLLFDGVSYPITLSGTPTTEAPASNSHTQLRFDTSNWLILK